MSGSCGTGALARGSVQHHKLNPLHTLSYVAIDHCQILRRQRLQLSPPAPVRHFHPQNAQGKINSPGPHRHCVPAGQWPCQYRTLSHGSAPQATGNHFFQSSAGLFHGSSHLRFKSVAVQISLIQCVVSPLPDFLERVSLILTLELRGSARSRRAIRCANFIPILPE